MIEFVKGNILETNCDVLVNPVNCVGTMGKGLAKAIKQKYPEILKPYVDACRKNQLRVGELQFVPTLQDGSPNWILNFPTKKHWKNKSDLLLIQKGLDVMILRLKGWYYGGSIAIPKLGCGLGGLKWMDVRSRIINACQELPEFYFQIYGEEN